VISVFIIFAFAFGAAIGSFINVVALRHHTGRTLAGRSHCAVCNATIAWYDLIPVASFLVLGGRCRQCRSRFSLRYIIAECMLGLVFVGVAARFDFDLRNIVPMVYYGIFWSVGAAIVLYDIEHKIIPDRFVVIAGILALFLPFTNVVNGNLAGALYQFLAGVLLALPFFLLWLISKGRWMGLGDAKLALVLGWLLGISTGLAAIVLSFWIGAAVSIALLSAAKLATALRRTSNQGSILTMQSEVPFAPFMLLGAFIAFFFELDPITFLHVFGG
jgi:prepilin signal peptidase PulO-like enzyme (type II secretory pathway)